MNVPELALSYCDGVYESGTHQNAGKTSGNIYLTLLQIYLNPRKTTKNLEKRINNPVTIQNPGLLKTGLGISGKLRARGSKKIAEIEVAEDIRISPSGTDSSKSDGDPDDVIEEEGGPTIMHDQVLDLLSKRWDRMHGAQALKLLPKETKLQVEYSFNRTVFLSNIIYSSWCISSSIHILLIPCVS